MVQAPQSNTQSCCIYRDVLDDLLQEGSVGHQLVVEWCVLQQHQQDLSEVWEFLVTQIQTPLQDHPQEAWDVAQRYHTSPPYHLPERKPMKESEPNERIFNRVQRLVTVV